VYIEYKMLSGDLKIHKTDVQTRPAAAVSETSTGSLRVWDSLPYSWEWKEMGGEAVVVKVSGAGSTERIIEPDIIAKPDTWERVERDGHGWKLTDPQTLHELAKRRDDVDEDELPDNI